MGVTVRDCARGGVYNAGGTVTVSDSIFADIDAGSSGAAITNEGGGELSVQRSAFERNLNGAILSVGPTTISDSAFTSNRGDSAGGGAINHTKTLRVSRCRFDDNQAAAGGAIYTAGDLTVEDSIFHRNQATLFEGGAIQLFNQTQSPSSVTVRASTFEENAAIRGGGAVRCDAPNGACTLENVTFSRNAATQTGGSTELSVKNGAVVVTHATVMAGGSPAIERAGGSLTLRNSIVTDGGCTGGVTDGGGNVQDQPGLCAAGFHDGDPALFALADNGGATPTHEIRAGSAAREIATTNCLPTDQRGVARPTTGCDAGAFQVGAVPLLARLVPNRTAAGGPDLTIVVHGASFLRNTTRVLWNGSELPAVATSPTELLVSVPAALIANPGVATVTIENPNPPVPDGGPATTSLPFTIDEATVPPPPPPPPSTPEQPVPPPPPQEPPPPRPAPGRPLRRAHELRRRAVRPRAGTHAGPLLRSHRPRPEARQAAAGGARQGQYLRHHRAQRRRQEAGPLPPQGPRAARQGTPPRRRQEGRQDHAGLQDHHHRGDRQPRDRRRGAGRPLRGWP